MAKPEKPNIVCQDNEQLPDLGQVIVSMLKENTGTHFLDSGFANGRHWQQNQVRDFDKEPATILTIEDYPEPEGSFYVRYNVYHYLKNFLEITRVSEDLNNDLHAFGNAPERESDHWTQLIEEWIEARKLGRVLSCNTYNGESLISQVLQYWLVCTETEDPDLYDTDIIVLQVHGGADVRGGYTAPRVFSISDVEYFLCADNDLSARCSKCEQSWQSDDTGYHWYPDGVGVEDATLPVKIDIEAKKLIHKDGCGGEIKIWVMENF